MPFDYENYQEKCNGMTAEELQREWENYTRQMSAGATSTATSILFMPLTAGISVVGVGLSAPRIHNARKKREIIEAGLKARGTTHHTRRGDVLAPMAVSGIIGGLTLGLVPPGVDSAAGVAVGRGIEIAAANTALTAAEAVVINNAKKKVAKEANTQNQEQNERYGTMAAPFVTDESVLAFQQLQLGQQPAQYSSTAYVAENPATVDQTSNSVIGETHAHPSKIDQNDQDQLSANPRMQTTHEEQATSDAALFASIPSHNLDLSHLLAIDEDVMLAMHALAVAAEKHAADKHTPEPAPNQVQSQETIQGQIGQTGSPPFLPQSQFQLLGSIEGNQFNSDKTAAPSGLDQPQWQPPAVPARHAPRSATLPARLYSQGTGSPSRQDTQDSQYPPQLLPPYQPQYFPSSQQAGMVAEPQQLQYYPPPPPPQQRHDSGYGSMHSSPSIGSSSPQTYYAPPPDLISRHSSIPQGYPPPPTSFYSPQMQFQQGHRASESPLYPMSPPPPYYPPPPAGKENDYFNQNAVPPPPTHTNSSQAQFNPLLEQPQKLVDGMNKGWQWVRASALPIKMHVDSKRVVEPDYGPPPTVPIEWRGS